MADTISIQSGLSPHILAALHTSITVQFENLPSTITGWLDWQINWLALHDDAGRFCFGSDLQSLQTIGGVSKVIQANYIAVLEILKKGMAAWLSGETLSNVEQAMGGTLSGQKIFCPKARELATNIAPRSLSYFSTFIVQIIKKIAKQNDTPVANLAVLECLPAAIARGADSPQKLAFMSLTKSVYRSRVEAHQDFNRRFETLVIPEDSDYSSVIQLMADMINK